MVFNVILNNISIMYKMYYYLFVYLSIYLYVSYFNSVFLCKTIETPLFSLVVVPVYNYTFSYFEFFRLSSDLFSYSAFL